MKKHDRLLPLLLALLLLLSTVPFAALADEEVEPTATHTHSYSSYPSDAYEWKNNTSHEHVTYTVHTCSCGYSYKDNRNFVSDESHSPIASSRTYIGSRVGDDGVAVDIYQYTCSACGGKFTKEESRGVIGPK